MPGNVSFVSGGRAIDEDERPLLPVLLFILGFSIVFTLLGAAGPEVLRVLRSTTAQRIGGLVVIGLGPVMLLYALGRRPAVLFAERRPLLETRAPPGTVGALPLTVVDALILTGAVSRLLAPLARYAPGL